MYRLGFYYTAKLRRDPRFKGSHWSENSTAVGLDWIQKWCLQLARLGTDWGPKPNNAESSVLVAVVVPSLPRRIAIGSPLFALPHGQMMLARLTGFLDRQ